MSSIYLVGRKLFSAGIFFLAVLLTLTTTKTIQAQCTAITVNVTTTAGDTSAGSLGAAINAINANCGGGTINLSTLPANSVINLTQNLPYLTQSVTILGSGVTVSGQSTYAILNLGGGVSIAAGLNDSISNLNLVNGKAQGSNGGSYNEGGGGGLGAGGGIFVNSGVTLTVNSVNFNGDSAVGGAGGNVTSPGNFSSGTYSGGGGGINGSGAGVNGYYSNGTEYSGAGGGVNGGTGSTADNQNGGTGGWGGGGGAAGWGGTGGTGGFGGGGGASDLFQGGNGGFGGGGGADGLGYTGGQGGLYGGRGGCSGCYQNADQAGGGGAGLGGGIFLYQGAGLNIAGSTFTSDTVQGGAAGAGAGSISTAGQGLGQDIFTYGSAIIFNGSSITTLADTISGTGSVVVAGTGSVTLSAVNDYSGGTTLSGGVLSIGNDNNMGTGNLTFDGGTLFTSAGITSSKGISVTGNGGTFNGNGFNSTLSGAITGTGLLGVTGSGALTLSGNNSSFSGGISVTGGTLDIGNANNLGTGTLSLNGSTLQTTAGMNAANNLVLTSNNGTIDTNGFNSTLGGVISGSGALTKISAGTLTLTGTNTYAGGTTVTGGLLIINNDNNLGLETGLLALNGGVTLQTAAGINSATRAIVLTGSDTFNSNGFNSTLGGTISGNGSLTKISAGTLTLTGTNTYGGGTTVTGGTLNINNDNNLGTGLLDMNGTTLQTAAGIDSVSRSIVLNGSVTFDSNGFNSTLGGVVSGTGSLTKISAGALTLTGTNTYGGGTTFTGGTISVSNDNNLGTGNLTFNGGTLQTYGAITSSKNIVLTANNGTFDTDGFNSSLSGTISGTGTLTKTSAGVLTLSGANNIGGLTINAGTVDMTTANQTVSILNGSVGTTLGLTGMTLTEGNATSSTFSGAITGTGSLTKVGSGALTLTGASNYSGGTTFAAGTINVSNDNNLGTGNLIFNGGTLQTASGITSAKNINMLGAGTFDTQTVNSTLSGVISGTGAFTKIGSGTLTLTGIETLTGQTNVNAGTLTLGSGGSLSSSTVNLAGGTLLDVTANSTDTLGGLAGSGGLLLGSDALSVGADNATTNFTGVISGTGGSLTKIGSGTLTLAGVNTYTGGTTFTAGTVVVSNDNNLGTGNLTFNGGTLTTTTGITSSKNIDFTSNNGTFNTNGVNSTLTGLLSGLGALTKSGTGTLFLTDASNNYGGGTTVTGGTLNINSDGNLGTGLLALSGATLQTAVGINSATRSIVLTGSDTIDTQTFNSTLSGVLSGAGGFTKIGSGALTLTSINTYGGPTTVSAGVLNIENDNNLGTGSLAFNGGTLQTAAGITSARNIALTGSNGIFDSNGFNSSLNGTISGAGKLIKIGAGAVTLTGITNNYSGGTSIGGGTVNVSRDNNLGTGSLTFNGGTLQTSSGITSAKNVSLLGNGTFDSNGFNSTLSGVISGSGEFIKTGSGALTLTGLDTYTGLTDVNAGTLVLGVTNTLTNNAAVSVEVGGTLDLSQDNQTLQLSGIGAVIFGSNSVTLGGSTNTTFTGVLSGAGSFTKVGTGVLTLTGTNTYSGGTEINAGTLNIGSDNNLGTGNITLNGGTLQTSAGITSSKNILLTSNNGIFDTEIFNSILSGNITGAGSLTKIGTGTLTLDGTNSFTGGVNLSSGTLVVGDYSSPGAYVYGSINVASGSTLQGYGSILGTVTDNGTVKVAGATGVLSIAQLTDTASSTTQLELGSGNGHSGLLNVFDAQLGGAVTILADAGNYGVRYKYIIVNAGAPISGTFSSVSDNLSYLTPTLNYGTNSVTLVLTRNNTDFTAFANTANEIAFAKLLNQSIATASDDFINHLNNLYNLSDSSTTQSLVKAGASSVNAASVSPAQAMAEMSGVNTTQIPSVALNNDFFSTNLLFNRLMGTSFNTTGGIQALSNDASANAVVAGANGIATTSPGMNGVQGFWLNGKDIFGNVSGSTGIAGFNTTGYGFVGGYDTPISSSLKGGVALAYNHTNLTATDSSNDVTAEDDYLGNLYATQSFGDVDLSAVAGFGWNQYATTRNISIGSTDVSQAQAAFGGNEMTLALQASMDLKIPDLTVKPLVGAQYSYLWENGYSENGAGSLDLSVAGESYYSIRPMVGVYGAKSFTLGGTAQLVPAVNLTASREMNALNPQLQAAFAGTPGQNFTVTGITPDPMLFGVGAGVKLIFSRDFNLSADYMGNYGDGQTSNGFNGEVDLAL